MVKSPRKKDCQLNVNGIGFLQEKYATGSGAAQVRAKDLRSQGYKVSVSPMGQKMTDNGFVKMTKVTVMIDSDEWFPPIA